jgi:tetratricopeptide (TPR) repeat protein
MNVHEKFQSALQHYQAGNLKEAERLYREILAVHPDNSPALHFLGVVYYQSGNYDIAADCIRQSLHFNKNNPDAYNHLGSILSAKGEFDEAIEFFHLAIELNPNSADAYFNLGNTLTAQRRFDEAINHYRKAIGLNPNFFAAYYNLGKAFQDKGNSDEAITSYKKALELNPNCAVNDAIGILYQEKGQLDEAITHYQKALELNPDFAGTYGNLGKAFQEKGHLDEALKYYTRALQLNADHIVLGNLYNNVGVIHQEKGQFYDAISYYQKALRLVPSLAVVYKNLGAVFHDMGLFDKAIAYYQKALAISRDAEIYCNLGNVFEDKGQLDESLICYQKALQINPAFAEAHWNISLTKLKSGNFEEGWGKYEWRLLKKDARPSLFRQREWDGASLKGKRLLIIAEQGVGDEIMFASCLPEVIAQADWCAVECDKRLIPLFARSFPKATVIGRFNMDIPYPSAFPPTDMKIAIGSIPKFLRTHLSLFPQQQSYLVSDERTVERWHDRFTALGKGLKIGISWRGGSKPAVRLARSTVLDQWTTLFSVAGVHFINLQYGDCSKEIREAEEKSGVTIHRWEDADPLKDLDGFAAQISAIDLVISVDNATVHMAGALGIPVWTLLPFACDWRWMREYEDTPWYKTVRLFRQRSQGDWNKVFERLTSDLKRYISTGVMPEIVLANSYKSAIKV